MLSVAMRRYRGVEVAVKRIIQLLSGWVAAMLLVGTAAAQTAKPNSSIAFERLSSLAGEWKGVQDGVDITLLYTLTADGSTLMEEFRPAKGPVMITMFTVDGDHLLATHYCAAGNQPNMSTKAIEEPQGKSLVFSLVRVTGMKTPDDFHNTDLEVVFEDPDHLTQNWTYLYKGKAGTTTLHLTRKRA